MTGKPHSVAIEGIWLMREESENDPLAKVVVYVQRQGIWYEAIREGINSNFSHCISSYGIVSNQCKPADWNSTHENEVEP